jgi:hypothetical protein
VGFAEIDDARIAGQVEHLRCANDGAGRQVNDLADLRRGLERIGILGIAHHLFCGGAAGGQGKKAESRGRKQRKNDMDHTPSKREKESQGLKSLGINKGRDRFTNGNGHDLIGKKYQKKCESQYIRLNDGSSGKNC